MTMGGGSDRKNGAQKPGGRIQKMLILFRGLNSNCLVVPMDLEVVMAVSGG